ncbi:MAG: orotate phosphoribosyltransferase [Gemmatimonadota bacterium]|nr:orotate phosphoribosyltransferase [Gemmatimonadota bacterium]
MADRDRLLHLLLQRSLRRGDFVLASGARSRFYIDCRTTTTHAEGQSLVGRMGLAKLHGAGLAPDSVGGLTMGADPVAYAIAHESWGTERPVHAFSVRKEPKAHGTGRRVEGCFAAGNQVVIVEDVITSGASALAACEAVRAEGGGVLAVLALVDRQGGGRQRIEAEGLPVHTLFDIGELLAASDA